VAADFSIKAHDLMPTFRVILRNDDANKTPVDLTNALSIQFFMRVTGGGGILKVNAPAAFVNPRTSGIVEYNWTGTDTDTPGLYQAEWEIMWAGNKPQTAPTLVYHSIEILADLDNA
jgi:hypothetical protein